MKRRRLRKLLAELAAHGVTIHREGRGFRVEGIGSPEWLPAWLEKNHAELDAILPRDKKRDAGLERLLKAVEEAP